MRTKETVKQLAKEVALGDTVTFTCPYCQKAWEERGRPITWRPSRSFSVSRDSTGVLYHCFRASCTGSSGFLPDITLEHIPKKQFKPREYTFDLLPVEGEERDALITKGFTPDEIQRNFLWNPQRGTMVFPIRDYRGYDVGVVDRDYTGRRDIKAISYWQSDVPRLHFVRPVPRRVERILVVEDIPSAIKGGRCLPAVALLGSYISPEQAKHLRELTDSVVLALDEDATDKAIKLQKKYGFYFRNFSVLPLSNKDIKDMNEQELEEFFRRLDA